MFDCFTGKKVIDSLCIIDTMHEALLVSLTSAFGQPFVITCVRVQL